MLETFQQHGIDCCVDGHECGDKGVVTLSPDCVAATVCAKRLSRQVAFTTQHPAYRRFIRLENHLTECEVEEVERQCPGTALL